MKTRIDKVLMKHGVDQTAQFGGYLEGNGCCKLTEAASIITDIEEYGF
jgi:hypothetical protein